MMLFPIHVKYMIFFFPWMVGNLPAHLNLPSYTAMERLIQQATVVRQCLSQEAGKVMGVANVI